MYRMMWLCPRKDNQALWAWLAARTYKWSYLSHHKGRARKLWTDGWFLHNRAGWGFDLIVLSGPVCLIIYTKLQCLKSVVQWDKQGSLIGGQAWSPYWGTNRLPLLGDKQVELIGGQTGWCPYWGTNRLPLLGGGQTRCPYWGTNWWEKYPTS